MYIVILRTTIKLNIYVANFIYMPQAGILIKYYIKRTN
jgi:hypothetical protein